MAEFWESSFKDKRTMWGFEPADAAITTAAIFQKKGLQKILIPGFGYGRNARVFTDNGLVVAGIEISETAIGLAKKYYGNTLKIYHGSVSDMPFDKELYDGIFCYALIHLLSEEERLKLIRNCYKQLKPNGYMVFVTISKADTKYGDGKEIVKDTFKTRQGVTLFFYDSDSVEMEFGDYGLIEAIEIEEGAKHMKDQKSQGFLQITCRKEKKIPTNSILNP